MRKIKHSLSLLAVGMLFAFNSSAQTAFSVTSNSATIQGHTFEYVIGEMAVIQTDRNPSIIVTQGFLQPVNGNKPSGVNNQDNHAIKVYPNPTDNIVFIESLDELTGNLDFTLFDATGKVLQNNPLAQNAKFSVDLSSYAVGNYYIIINHTNPEGKLNKYSYKIQKK